MFEHISIRAGQKAIKIIQDEGFRPSRVKVVAGGSGGPKFLVLTGLDRVIAPLFKRRKKPLFLIGTSIGAFRMAAYCAENPVEAIDTLERAYIAQSYIGNPKPREVTAETRQIIRSFIEDEIEYILNHPFMRLSFISTKCKGFSKHEHPWIQCFGLATAFALNWWNRNWLGWLFERALFQAGKAPLPFTHMNQFPINRYRLTKTNIESALLSSGSIPMVMEGVTSISGAPGVFRDGGIIDYHLDIPFLSNDDSLVLYPHFFEHITPGWFDKSLNRIPDDRNMSNVLLVAPSKKFVDSLPLGKIPDRKDFEIFLHNDEGRTKYWKKVVETNKILADEFFEAINTSKIKEILKPI